MKEKEEGVRYFVPGLPELATDDDLRGHFNQYGTVLDASVVREKVTGLSRGFGYVEMADASGQELLLSVSHEMGGKAFSVMLTKDSLQGYNINKVHLGKLPLDMSPEPIKEVFSQFGTVLDVHLPKDPRTGERRNYGFVTLGSEEAFTAAVNTRRILVAGAEVSISPAAQSRAEMARDWALNGKAMGPRGGHQASWGPYAEGAGAAFQGMPREEWGLWSGANCGAPGGGWGQGGPADFDSWYGPGGGISPWDGKGGDGGHMWGCGGCGGAAAAPTACGGSSGGVASRKRQEGTRYFVPGLPESVTDDELHAHFSRYGMILDVAVVKEKGTDRSRGFGYVTMGDSSTREAILSDRHEFHGTPVTVMLTKDSLTGTDVKKVHLGKLSIDITIEDIRNAFSRFGPILDVHTPKDPKTGERKNFGFVTFSSDQAFNDAVNTRRVLIKGQEITIRPAAQCNNMMGPAGGGGGCCGGCGGGCGGNCSGFSGGGFGGFGGCGGCSGCGGCGCTDSCGCGSGWEQPCAGGKGAKSWACWGEAPAGKGCWGSGSCSGGCCGGCCGGGWGEQEPWGEGYDCGWGQPTGKGCWSCGKGGGKGGGCTGPEGKGGAGAGTWGAAGGATQGHADGIKYFVAGLPEWVSDSDLVEHFSQYGQLADAAVVKDKRAGSSRGFGYVTMADASSQERLLNSKHVFGNKLVSLSLTKESLTGVQVKKVHLGRLDVSISQEAIRDAFSQFGVVLDVHTPKDPSTGERKNFGFVSFSTDEAFQAAINTGHIRIGQCDIPIRPAAQSRTDAAASAAASADVWDASPTGASMGTQAAGCGGEPWLWGSSAGKGKGWQCSWEEPGLNAGWGNSGGKAGPQDPGLSAGWGTPGGKAGVWGGGKGGPSADGGMWSGSGYGEAGSMSGNDAAMWGCEGGAGGWGGKDYGGMGKGGWGVSDSTWPQGDPSSEASMYGQPGGWGIGGCGAGGGLPERQGCQAPAADATDESMWCPSGSHSNGPCGNAMWGNSGCGACGGCCTSTACGASSSCCGSCGYDACSGCGAWGACGGESGCVAWGACGGESGCGAWGACSGESGCGAWPTASGGVGDFGACGSKGGFVEGDMSDPTAAQAGGFGPQWGQRGGPCGTRAGPY